LIGFNEQDADLFQAYFELEQDKENGITYFCLSEDSLQDPDLLIVNADDVRALARLSSLNPSALCPALLIGTPFAQMPFVCLARPIRWEQVFAELAQMLEKRAKLLTHLSAADRVSVSNRRRRERLDIDLTDQADYIKMRRAPSRGGVLVIDRNGSFADRLNEVMTRYSVVVDWVDTEEAAIDVCGHVPVSVVMINTSMTEIDPYELCMEVKQANPAVYIAVIFLVGKNFKFDANKARAVKFDGLLDKPLSVSQVLIALKKFLLVSR
jgi:CheY-like chemotaxis protein